MGRYCTAGELGKGNLNEIWTRFSWWCLETIGQVIERSVGAEAITTSLYPPFFRVGAADHERVRFQVQILERRSAHSGITGMDSDSERSTCRLLMSVELVELLVELIDGSWHVGISV